MTDSIIKDRIRKLLRLAQDDAAADGEIDNALRFARRLMLQHNLSESDVAPASGGAQDDAADVEYGKSVTASCAHKLARWESHLAHAVAELVGTVRWYRNASQVVQRDGNGILARDRLGNVKTGSMVCFYGPAADAAEASSMFAEWSLLVIGMAQLKYGGAFRGPGRSYAEGFCLSLFNRVRKQVSDERKAIDAGTESNGCTALVLRDAHGIMARKREGASTWLRQVEGVRLRAASGGTGGAHYGDAFGDGSRDGQAAAFQRQRQKRLTS